MSVLLPTFMTHQTAEHVRDNDQTHLLSDASAVQLLGERPAGALQDGEPPLRIGILLPASFSLGNPANGVAEQARQQAAALERLGHCVIRLDPWQWQCEEELDVLQFYVGGLEHAHVTLERQLTKPGLLVFAPIIDSNQPFWAYRLAAEVGARLPRFFNVPGTFRQQALGSDVVICRSQHERERVVRGLGIPDAKVATVLNGCHAPQAVNSANVSAVKRAFGLPDEFILHVSAFTQERKNVIRLARATAELQLPLVIAGRATPGPVLDELDVITRQHPCMHVLGLVDAVTKEALYSLCKVFCLPSSHEGTGLAALEACVHGAALVITKNGGTRDYFLDHAEYVDPFELADIKAAILRAWHKPRSDTLQRHIVRNLSWDQSARSLAGVYERCLEHKSAHALRQLSKA